MTKSTQVGARLNVRIADFVVALNIEDPGLAARVESRYRQFLDRGLAPHIMVTVTAVPDALYLPVGQGNWVIESALEGDLLHFRSYQEQGVVDTAAGTGRLEMAPTADIENFLRVVYAHLCLKHDALLLHAGGILRQSDGLGYVFFGPSGAGKTTTTMLSRDRGTILSDDLVVIRLTANGCRLFGVPFRGELMDAPRANQNAPLQAIFRLRQSDANAVHRLSPSIAVAELAAAAPFTVGEPRLQDRLMEVCSQIAHRVPVSELHFRRDDTFWSTIDEQFSALSPATSSDSRARD